jgi:hypothetical protein
MDEHIEGHQQRRIEDAKIEVREQFLAGKLGVNAATEHLLALDRMHRSHADPPAEPRRASDY